MIVGSASLPLRPAERRAAAYLARYHRKRVPSPEEQEIVGENEQESLQLLLAILRTADALDGRRLASPGLAMRLTGRQLEIHCHIRRQWKRACRTFQKRRKFRLLKDLVGIDVQVQLRDGQFAPDSSAARLLA